MSAPFSAIMMVGGIGIARHDGRHDGGVDHPQAVDPADTQPGINHRVPVAAHLAAADRVIHRLCILAKIGRQLGIRLRGSTRRRLADDVVRHGRCREDSADDANAFDHRSHILVGREVVELDIRRFEGIRRAQGDLPARSRPDIAHRSGDRRVVLRDELSVFRDDHAEGPKLDLQVGRLNLAIGAREGNHLGRCGGQDSGAADGVLQHLREQAPRRARARRVQDHLVD